VGGIAVLVASRLRRADVRTGWILAVGGAALTSAVAFSTAKGIFHPYYVSFLAPFVAALVGAGFGQLTRGEIGMRWLAPLAIAGGVVSELIVLHNNPGSFEWLPPVLVVAGVATAAVATAGAARIRRVALATALAVLLMAPATWAAQTLGHATNGTFPAGGPASAGFGGGGPGAGRFGGPPTTGSTQAGPQGFGPGGTTGGPFGGNSNLTEAVTYVRSHGAARSRSRARPARRARSSPRAPRWPPSAASPAARARSACSGSPRRCATAGSAGS
jgi:hypothetical protein